jgi:two-component system response regulator YesN
MPTVDETGILLVDDDPNSREGLKLSLRAEGYRVRTAVDLWDMIRTIKAGRFDIAIIDLDLPPLRGLEVTGWDLARIVRAYHPGIAIIVIGAEDAPEVRSEAVEVGIAAFLVKPISPARIKEMVRQLRPSGCGRRESAITR